MIYTIQIDTREKRPFVFKSPTINKSMKIGDYGIEGINYGYVERKGVDDIVNCCYNGIVTKSKISNFEIQLQKLQTVERSILVIEGTPVNFIQYAKMQNTKVQPDAMLHWFYRVMSQYKTVTYWARDREDAQNFTEWHLLNVAKHHQHMLQLAEKLPKGLI
jgi:ERCC4-type nuclease